MALTEIQGSGIGTLTDTITIQPNSGNLVIKAGTIDATNSIRLEAGGTTSTYLEYRGYLGHQFVSNTSLAMTIDGNGIITKPLQPAFYAVVNSSQDNIATGQWHAIIFGLERFDSNADFNNSNGTFTAPVTGKYQLNTSIRLTAADTAANAYLFRLNGSNRAPIANYDGNQYATDTEITVQLSALLDMDANDTVTVELYQDGGTAQTDIQNGEYSFFNGILVG